MNKSKTIKVKGAAITVLQKNGNDYISLTDMIKGFGDDAMIYSWMRNRNTLEFIGIWEELNNPDFKGDEFVTFKKQAGLNSFNLTPRKWIEATKAIGIFSKAGRYGGGTFAHRDIAFEFGSWLSAEFKLYLIKEFQRLKEEESNRYQQEWSVGRALARVNYRIHTDAIKEHLIPPKLTQKQIQLVYASEADLLNMAVFGKTASAWRNENPGYDGNIRDQASLEQLVVVANLESMNALFIEQGMDAPERLKILNRQAIQQVKSLLGNAGMRQLRNKG